MERLILDTGVLVALERGAHETAQAIADTADVALAAVTAAELLVGVELASDEHRERRSTLVEVLLARLPVVAYDLSVARRHSLLLAHTRRSGTPRGAHDLIIAATAATTRRTILTTDVGAFDDLPGVEHRIVKTP